DLNRVPREPLAAIEYVSKYLRYLGNLRALGRESKDNVAVILRGIDQIAPADGSGFEHGSITSLLREWAGETPFCDLPFTSLLIADNLNDVEPLLAFDTRVARIRLPLPDAPALQRALEILRAQYGAAFASDAKLDQLAAALTGVTVSALESLIKVRAHA